MIKKKFLFIYVLMPLLVFVVFLFSLSNGSTQISFFNIFEILFNNKSSTNTIIIIKQIRLPRVIMSCIVGAGLSISGCVFQAILKNPLADPFTLGISGGAAFGVAVAFICNLTSIIKFSVPLCAFIGAMFSVCIIYLLNIKKNFDSHSMILSGVITSYIFSSATMLIFALSPTNNIQYAFLWLMGNLSTFDEKMLPFITTIVAIGIITLSLSGNIINAISLNNEKSKTLGVNTERNIKFLFIVTSLIVASIVSICGVIGFIGIIIPHIMRRIIKTTNNVVLIPASAFAGAIFLPFCDTLSRTLFSPLLIPIGITTNIIGGLFFIYLLSKSRKI